MKKAAIAMAVMAGISSLSAFASNSPMSGEVTMSGVITAPHKTWTAKIESNPSDLNNLNVTTDAWTGSARNWEYKLTETPWVPLVTLTTGSSTLVGNYLIPQVTIGGSTNLLGPTDNERWQEVEIDVQMDAAAGDSFSPTPDVSVKLKIAGNICVATSKPAHSSTGYYACLGLSRDGIPTLPRLLGQNREAITLLTNDGVDVSYETTYPDGETASVSRLKGLLAGNVYSGVTNAAASGVAGTFGVVMTSTRAEKPIGSWQAKVPVEITYV